MVGVRCHNMFLLFSAFVAILLCCARSEESQELNELKSMVNVLQGKYEEIEIQLREKDDKHLALKTEMYQLKKEMYEMNKDMSYQIRDKDQQIIEVTKRMTEKFEDLTTQLIEKDERITVLEGRLQSQEIHRLEMVNISKSNWIPMRNKQSAVEPKYSYDDRDNYINKSNSDIISPLKNRSGIKLGNPTTQPSTEKNLSEVLWLYIHIDK